MFSNLVLHAMVKHIELGLYVLGEKIQQKLIEVWHIHKIDQLADGLTKAISSSRFNDLRSNLILKDLSTLSLRGLVMTIVPAKLAVQRSS